MTIIYTKIFSQEKAFKDFLLSDDGIAFRTNSKAIVRRGGIPNSVSNYISMLGRLSKIVSNESNTDFDIFCFKGQSADIDRIFTFAKKFAPQSFIEDVNSPIEKYKLFNDKYLQNISGVETTLEISK